MSVMDQLENVGTIIKSEKPTSKETHDGVKNKLQRRSHA